MSKIPVTIYALKDDAARIVYVGQTANPGFRLGQHETDPKRRKVFASASVLEIVPRADANATEKRWIQQLIAEGQPLSNINHNQTLKKPKPAQTTRSIPVAAPASFPMEEEDFLTVQQAANEAGMSVDGIRAAMYRGKLPYRTVFERQVIARADLEAYKAKARRGRPKKDSGGNGGDAPAG